MISHIPTRRRRRCTPAFMLQVINDTRTPGTSLAEVARRHDLNTNIVPSARQRVECAGRDGRMGVPQAEQKDAANRHEVP